MFIYLITAPLNEVYQYNVWGRDVHSAAYALTSWSTCNHNLFWRNTFLLNQYLFNTYFKGLNYFVFIKPTYFEYIF